MIWYWWYNPSGQPQVSLDSIGQNFPSQPQNTLNVSGNRQEWQGNFLWKGGNIEQDQVHLGEPPAGGQFKDKLLEFADWSYSELLFHIYHKNSVIPHSLVSQSLPPHPQADDEREEADWLLRRRGSNPQLRATNWFFLSGAFCFLYILLCQPPKHSFAANSLAGGCNTVIVCFFCYPLTPSRRRGRVTTKKTPTFYHFCSRAIVFIIFTWWNKHSVIIRDDVKRSC